MVARRVKVIYEVENAGLVKGTRESVKVTEELKQSSQDAGKAAEERARKVKVVADADQRAAKAAGLLYAATGQLVDSNGKVLSSSQAAAHGVESFSEAVYLAGYESEQAAAKEVKASEEAAAATAKRQKAMQKLAPAVTAIGVATLAGSAIAVRASMVFEKAMSSVEAATHAGTIEMGQLRQAAIDAGADTAFSAVEAAKGIEELAKAGVSTADIMAGGLAGALDLAAAGNLGVGEAAEIAATAMTQFKLSGDQIPHLADLLAAGAGKAQGGVKELGDALGQAGLVASSTGLTIEETTGGLAAFASAGLLGSDAGTSFKTMLQRLTPQSKAAQGQFDELGISAYDAQGNFVGLTDFAGQLQTKMADLSPEARNAAMSVMFGSDAVRASNVLYEQGAEGIQQWIDNVNDAGYAAETAALMQNNLAGDLEKLGGAFDTVLIKSGSGANEALRGLVQGLESVVDTIAQVPEPVLAVAGIITGLAGGAALLTGGLITGLPKIRDTRDALRDLAPAGSRAAKGLDRVNKSARSLAKGGAIAGGILAIGTGLAKWAESNYSEDIVQGTGHVAVALQELINNAPNAEAVLDAVFKDRTGDNLAGVTGDIGALDGAIEQLFSGDPGDQFDRWGQKTVNALTGIKGTQQFAEEAFGGIDTELAALLNSGNAEGAAKAFGIIRDQLDAAGVSAEDSAYLFPMYSDALQRVSAESDGATEGTEELQGALDEVGVSAEGLVTDMEAFLELLFQTGVLTRSERGAYRDYQAAIDDISDSIEKNGKTLDVNTEKGRANESTLDALADKGKSYVETLAARGASEEELQTAMSGTYDSMIDALGQLDITGEAADEMARKIMGIPEDVSIETWMSEVAKSTAQDTTESIAEIPGYTEVTVAVTEQGTVGEVQSKIHGVTGKEEFIFVDDQGTTTKVQQAIINVDGVDRTVWVDDKGSIISTQDEINQVKGKGVSVVVGDDGTSYIVQQRINGVTGKTEFVIVDDNGTVRNVQQEIRNVDGVDRTVWVDDNGSVYNTQAEINGVQGSGVIITADAATQNAKNELAGASKDRTMTIWAKARKLGSSLWSALGLEHGGRVPALESGGRLPGFSDGGQLPSTGLGTDSILGINAEGTPVAWVDDLEWVVNRRSSNKYNGLLNAVNNDDPSIQHLAGYANGGQLNAVASDPPYIDQAGSFASPGQLMTRPDLGLRQYEAQSVPAIDYERMAQAVVAAAASSLPIDNNIQVDGKAFAKIMTNVTRDYIKRR